MENSFFKKVEKRVKVVTAASIFLSATPAIAKDKFVQTGGAKKLKQ